MFGSLIFAKNKDYNVYRGGPPQNGSEIPPFSGSRNGPYKDIRFGATLRNDHDNFSPTFSGLSFGKPSKQSCTQGNLQTAQLSGNHAETHAKTIKIRTKWRKLLGNPAETQENLQETSGNPSETPRKPCRNPRKPLHSPFGNWKYLNEGWRPITSKEALQGPCQSIIRPAASKGCAALWSQRSMIALL